MNSLDGLMIVGLTGQTGAGKSTVSKIFSGKRLCSNKCGHYRKKSG